MNQQMGIFGKQDDRICERPGGGWKVASFHTPGEWVTVSASGRCDCFDFEYRRHCRHIDLLVETGRLVHDHARE